MPKKQSKTNTTVFKSKVRSKEDTRKGEKDYGKGKNRNWIIQKRVRKKTLLAELNERVFETAGSSKWWPKSTGGARNITIPTRKHLP